MGKMSYFRWICYRADELRTWDKGTSINYVTLKGGGGQRFVTNHCKDIGICTVFCYKGGGGLKSQKIALRNMWTSPNGLKFFRVCVGLVNLDFRRVCG
jgi:hypothetical protein